MDQTHDSHREGHRYSAAALSHRASCNTLREGDTRTCRRASVAGGKTLGAGQWVGLPLTALVCTHRALSWATGLMLDNTLCHFCAVVPSALARLVRRHIHSSTAPLQHSSALGPGFPPGRAPCAADRDGTTAHHMGNQTHRHTRGTARGGSHAGHGGKETARCRETKTD